jgi:hypothetical protein
MRGAGGLVNTVADQLALERGRARVQIDLAERFRLGRDLEHRAMRPHEFFKDVAADREVVVCIRYADPSTPREVAASTHGRRSSVSDCASPRGSVGWLRENRGRRLSMH